MLCNSEFCHRCFSLEVSLLCSAKVKEMVPLLSPCILLLSGVTICRHCDVKHVSVLPEITFALLLKKNKFLTCFCISK